jgi:hypothetical protein
VFNTEKAGFDFEFIARVLSVELNEQITRNAHLDQVPHHHHGCVHTSNDADCLANALPSTWGGRRADNKLDGDRLGAGRAGGKSESAIE